MVEEQGTNRLIRGVQEGYVSFQTLEFGPLYGRTLKDFLKNLFRDLFPILLAHA